MCVNALDSPVVAPTLPIPQHGLLKDQPSFVATCTPQGLVVKVTCMQDCCRRIPPACIDRELLPFQLSIIFVHHLAQPESLGVMPGFCIAALLNSVLKAWLVRVSPDCCHERPSLVSKKACMHNRWCACLAVPLREAYSG